jgi:hypothetical protein
VKLAAKEALTEIELNKLKHQKEIVLAAEERISLEIFEEINNQIDQVKYNSNQTVYNAAMSNLEVMKRVNTSTERRVKVNNHADKRYLTELVEAGMLDVDDAKEMIVNCNEDTEALINIGREIKNMHEEATKNLVANRFNNN